MPLALGTAALVLMGLLSVLAMPRLQESLLPALRALPERVGRRPEPTLVDGYDPGRELRAEQRARALLRSCVNGEEWAMYSELGFLRVWSKLEESSCAYLLYPHKPVLAYTPHNGALLGEYCIEFPDRTRPYGSARLPDADDVLAKWVALSAGERSLIEQSNMHLPGRQIRIAQARRDLVRLCCWEREHLSSHDLGSLHAGSVHAL